MKCKKIKDLLLTDYIDGQINSDLKRRIDEHLSRCQDCRDFAAQLNSTVIKPFRESTLVEPPYAVWQGIKEEITPQREYEQGLFRRLRDNLKHIFTAPKPVFAMATALTLIIAAFIFTQVPFNGKKATNNYLQEQIDFLGYLEISEDYTNGYMSLDTAIEEYFL